MVLIELEKINDLNAENFVHNGSKWILQSAIYNNGIGQIQMRGKAFMAMWHYDNLAPKTLKIDLFG